MFGIVFLVCSPIVYAGDSCQFIRIQKDKAGGGSRISLIPEKITVPVGTCTVWINFVREGAVRVSFREKAKQCMLSTEAQTGFSEFTLKTGESCYISETLSLGKTASLYWSKPGIYKYTIEAPAERGTAHSAKNIMAEGAIEVK